MRKLISSLLFLAVAVIAGYLFRAYTGALPIDLSLVGDTNQQAAINGPHASRNSLVDTKTPDTIRIASFNIESFGSTKANNSQVMNALTHIVREFDIVAIQEIRSKDQTLIPHFVSLINADGSQYEYELGPRLGRTNNKEQYAFLFNLQTIEIDRQATYTVADPHDRMHREPLVALFRARTQDPSTAFTFKLVNIHVDPDDVREEMNALRDVHHVVSNDIDQEDDVILLGDFNTHEKRIYGLSRIPEITAAIEGKTTNASGTESYDNLYFQNQQTREFNGKSGVMDLMRIFNLTTQQVLKISDHFPVWAEFSIFEGGRHRRFATRAASRAQSD